MTSLKNLVNDTKLLTSKTLWVNGITLAVGIFGLINDIYSPEWIIPILAASNIVLRFVTNEPILPEKKND